MDFDGPLKFEEEFTAGETHILTGLSAVIPKVVYSFLLTHDHVGGGTCLCDFGEGFESAVGRRFHQSCMTDKRDAFELGSPVATPIEGPTIERAHKTVIANESNQRHRVNRALGEKGQYLRFNAVAQPFG